MFAEEVPGLGVTVTITTRFDPTRIRERLTHWLEKGANEAAKQVREQINASGVYYPDENGRVRKRARNTAIEKGLKNLSWVIRSVDKDSVNSTKQMITSLVTQLGLAIATYWIPGVGWAMALHSVIGMFGKKEKKPYPIPWDDIYSQVLPYAKAQTNKEELYRIEKEIVEVKEIHQKAITKASEAAAMFKLPEGVTSITKGGALVVNLKSQARTIEPVTVKELLPVSKPIIKRAPAPKVEPRVAHYR